MWLYDYRGSLVRICSSRIVLACSTRKCEEERSRAADFEEGLQTYSDGSHLERGHCEGVVCVRRFDIKFDGATLTVSMSSNLNIYIMI
jgi:hypothetical protein